jgi:hydrogenase nickel incorporation protein HypB
MCDTCGCGTSGPRFTLLKTGHPEMSCHEHEHEPGHPHAHDHDHSLPHVHDHDQDGERQKSKGDRKIIAVETDVLQKNVLLAQRNRGYFEAKSMMVLNLVSSPGSGKTTLLEKTLHALKGKISMGVIEGDQQTTLDAQRINKTGIPVVQINTGSGCHLDASMVNRAVKDLDLPEHSLLLIENVGNLVCPSLFDLGENFRVVIVSVTEGEDKPLKYPQMFMSSHVCLINKTDLIPYLDFSLDKFKENLVRVNHHLEIMELSARTETGMDQWINWLRDKMSVNK